MKKLLLGLLIFATMFCFAGCLGATGNNVTEIVTTNNLVFFDPKCPECKHIGYSKSVNLSKGEEYESIHQCEKCGEIYDISIKR